MASRVAEILMEQGRNAAEAARAKGAIWGGLAERLGQLPGQAIQQAQQQKQQKLETDAKQQRLDLDTAHLGLLQQEEQDRVAAQTHQREGVALTGDLVKKNSKLNPESGHYEYDNEAITNGLITAGHPEAAGHWQDLGTKLQDSIAETQTQATKLEASKQQTRANILGAVADAPEADRAMRYGMMVNALPPGSEKDPVFGKLPPIYPGHPAFSAMYDATQTEAQRATKAKELAAEKLATGKESLAASKEALAESRATATETETARHNRAMEARPTAGAGGGSAVNDVKESVTAMREGTAPPLLPGRATKEYLATIAEAHRQKFDIAGAALDWTATQKHVSTMNSSQQLKLNQSINALPEMLDKVDDLASKWKGGRFPALNKANLALAKGGAYGQDVASVANQLDAQIADVTADLGNVYMGGNSPTDHALGLAAKSLSGDWSESVLHDMTKLARNNVQIRSNSIKHTGVAGASATNPYDKQESAAAPSAGGGVPSNVAKALRGAKPGKHTLSDGSVWMIDASGNVSK